MCTNLERGTSAKICKNDASFAIPVVIIFGPTASGKTSLAERLFAKDAQSFFAGKAEIISADSLQVYKELCIGTAKPSNALLQKLPHHLIDCINPQKEFSVADFVQEADTLCKDIFLRGKIPVIVGGTAFYIKHFMYGLPRAPEPSDYVRNLILHKLINDGKDALYAWLCNVDKASAQKIHPNDEYRICRALEVFVLSGKPLSSFALPQKPRTEYRFCPFAIQLERETLYARIEERVDKMVQAGLFEEVNGLLQKGFTKESPAMQAIGYREFFIVANAHNCNVQTAPKDEIIALIKHNTKAYAKKQDLFFRSQDGIFKIGPYDDELVAKTICTFLQQN